MRLSQIKLAGFKTFVDTARLPLPSNLTAVVGPNGCGKSNLIDAVRWVLGEMSMKQLRSASSEDVIFNGSRTRKPVGRASVELVFDNSDHALQGPYAHYTEVAVRRELTRDGQSQYFLNGSKCLRRDVIDLFLGTGLGARSGYAIIEQGMVSRMIEAKPEELRQWLEEAAGISRYRERRRETESRIRSTRDNLARIDDLCGEVRARARALERQAENARKYRQFREEADKLKVELHFLKTRDMEQQAAQAQESVQQAEAALAETRQAHVRARDARLRAEVELESARKGFAERQSEHYEAEAERARNDQSLRHARELADMRARELSQLDQERQRAQQQSGECEAQAEQAREREAGLQEQLTTAEAARGEAQRVLDAAEQALEDAVTALSQHDTASQEPQAQLAAERARLREREQGLERLQARLRQLQNDAEQHPAPDDGACRETAECADAARTALQQAQQKAEQAEATAEAAESRRSELEERVTAQRAELGRLQGEQASLQTLQQAAFGDDDASVRDWLHALGLADAQRLAQRVQVQGGWDAAVEHVLGRLLQAPLTGDLRAALAAQDGVPERGACLVREHDGGPVGAPDGSLAQQVSAPAAIQRLLASVRCADDRAEAEALLPDLAPGESVILRDGTWLSPDWLRLPERGDGQGVIARAQRLEQIATQVEQAAARLAEDDQALQAARTAQQEAVAERRRTAQALEQSRQEQSRTAAEAQQAQQRFELARARHEQLHAALQEVRSELDGRQQDVEALRASVTALEADCTRLAEQRGALEQSVAAARSARDEHRQALAAAAQRHGDTHSRLAEARSEAQAAQTRAQELAARARSLADAWQERQQQPAQDAALETAQAALRNAETRLETTTSLLTEARSALEQQEQALGRGRNEEQKSQAAVDEQQAALQQAQLGFQSLDAQRQMLAGRFAEFGVARDEVAAGIDEDAEAGAWQERLERTERRIERLGAINLAAIDELAETQARAEELEKQHADITEALETLEAAIRKIDRETRERFRDTFNRVNERFSARFPRLFGGGEAALELTDDDLLAAGVRVMARPPGKRNTSIHLLSGGEKAMTAVALLLALFELNPAPFCLLDEVDAPLDDANVSRFCDVIQEMSGSVQFVIITHNKITMALADHLHGVTMQEPGSSRLVSVDVQEAVSLAGEAA